MSPEPSPTSLDLEQRIRELEERLGALEERPRLSVEMERLSPSLSPFLSPFLGQAVPLVARVTDARGRPLAGVSVTLVTTWGQLETQRGYEVERGLSAAGRSRPTGSFHTTLVPRLAESLTREQSNALEAALGELDPGAATPEAARSGLEEMVKLYRWESNLPLRRGVDLLFRDLERPALDAINALDALARWPQRRATVIAYTLAPPTGGDAGQPGAGGGGAGGARAVSAMAVLDVGLRDWLVPWLTVYREVVARERRLATLLERARDRGGSAGVLVEGLSEEVRSFVGRQRGRVGEAVGERVAQEELRGFLSTATGELDAETRSVLTRDLGRASASLARTGVATLGASGSLGAEGEKLIGRVDELALDLTAKADGSALEALDTRLTTSLQTKVSQDEFQSFKAVEFEPFRDESQQELTRLRTDFNDLSLQGGGLVTVGQLTTALETTVSQETFDGFVQAQDEALASKADLQAFDEHRLATQRALRNRAAEIAVLDSKVERNLQALATRVPDFQIVPARLSPGTPIDPAGPVINLDPGIFRRGGPFFDPDED